MRRLYTTIDGWLNHIPSSVLFKIEHTRAKRRYHNYLRRQLGISLSIVDPGPVGAKDIILKTNILDENDIPIKLNPDYYFFSGYSMMYSWLRCLERYSFNLPHLKSVMEFGCGSARLIRHLRCLSNVRLVGTDVEPAFVDWCRSNLTGIEFYANNLDPPLTFAEDDSFDFVFGCSVFTHIQLNRQGSWIKELGRVLRPGGVLMVNLLGDFYKIKILDDASRERLEHEGHFTLDATDLKASYSTRAIGSWDVFQSREEILAAFGSTFHIHEFKPGVLDRLVLENRKKC